MIAPELVYLADFMQRGIPFNQHLELKVDALTRGRCVLRLPFRAHLIGDPMRPALHGGVISMLADTAGGAACFSALKNPNDRVSTVDLRVDYLRPGAAEDIVCVAEVVRIGNRVGVSRMHLYNGGLPKPDEPDQPVATGQAVYNIVRGKA